MSVPNCHENRFPLFDGHTNQEQNTPKPTAKSIKKAAKACKDRYGSEYPISEACIRNYYLTKAARSFESKAVCDYELEVQTRAIFEYCYPDVVTAKNKAKLKEQIVEEKARLEVARDQLARLERYVNDLERSFQSNYS